MVQVIKWDVVEGALMHPSKFSQCLRRWAIFLIFVSSIKFKHSPEGTRENVENLKKLPKKANLPTGSERKCADQNAHWESTSSKASSGIGAKNPN